MAISRLKSDFLGLINQEAALGEELRKKSGTRDFHQIEITADETAGSFVKGTQRVLLMAGYTKTQVKAINDAHNNLDKWKGVINNLFTEFAGGPRVHKYGFNLVHVKQLRGTVTGLYMLPPSSRGSNSRRLKMRLFNVKASQKANSNMSDITLKGFSTAMRDHAWEKWKATLPPSLGIKRLNQMSAGSAAAFGLRTPFVHESSSAIGTSVLENIQTQVLHHKDTLPEMELLGVPTVYHDIVKSVIKSLNVDFEEKIIVTSSGEVKTARIIKGSLGGLNFPGSEPGDITKIRKSLMDGLSEYLDNNAHDFGFDSETGIDYEMSKPIRKVIAENAIHNIVKDTKKKIKKGKNKKVVVKSKAKKAESESRKSKLKSSTAYKAIPGAVGVKVAAKAAKRVEEKKQEKAKGLNTLRAQIQKRLPAEVRRNMGRPELINRTGVFSDSAQLVNLRKTKMGISGQYTYKLNPYATFESLGNRKWPAGYNPKPLIAKSIRNLAMQYTEDRIVSLRRI